MVANLDCISDIFYVICSKKASYKVSPGLSIHEVIKLIVVSDNN